MEKYLVDFDKIDKLTIKVNLSSFNDIKNAIYFLRKLNDLKSIKEQNIQLDLNLQVKLSSLLQEYGKKASSKKLLDEIINNLKNEGLQEKAMVINGEALTVNYMEFMNDPYIETNIKEFVFTSKSFSANLQKSLDELHKEINDRKKDLLAAIKHNSSIGLKKSLNFYKDNQFPEIFIGDAEDANLETLIFLFEHNKAFKKNLEVMTSAKRWFNTFNVHVAKLLIPERVSEWVFDKFNENSKELIKNYPEEIRNFNETTRSLFFYNYFAIASKQEIENLPYIFKFENLLELFQKFNLFEITKKPSIILSDNAKLSYAKNIAKNDEIYNLLLKELDVSNNFYNTLIKCVINGQTIIKVENCLSYFEDKDKFNCVKQNMLKSNFKLIKDSFVIFFNHVDIQRKDELSMVIIERISKLKKKESILPFVDFLLKNESIAENVNKNISKANQSKMLDIFTLQYKLQKMNLDYKPQESIKNNLKKI